MRLKNCKLSAYLQAEGVYESVDLLRASMAPYSPRAAGLDVQGYRILILMPDEAEALRHEVLRDDRLDPRNRWAICHLLACWLSGEIVDEAVASHD